MSLFFFHFFFISFLHPFLISCRWNFPFTFAIFLRYFASLLFLFFFFSSFHGQAVIRWAGEKFSSSGCLFVTYEQIHPDDQFGQIMMQNLKERGCPLLVRQDKRTMMILCLECYVLIIETLSFFFPFVVWFFLSGIADISNDRSTQRTISSSWLRCETIKTSHL